MKQHMNKTNSCLNKTVSELELSVRSFCCLKAADIRTIAQLVAKSEKEMLELHNFGEQSLIEIKKGLKEMGLCFGYPIIDPRLMK